MALLLIVAALVLLHAVLLWQRLDDRSIARPEVAVRWIVAAAIAGAALLLRRVAMGSRAWIVFWLTVALLHLAGPAGAVLTQAVLTATPLLLMFVAVAMGVACGNAPFVGARTSRVRCAPVIASVRDRAPPSR
jgi:hypothetical protein